MRDKTENFFAALCPRATDNAQMDIDGIGASIGAIANVLDTLDSDKKGIFAKFAGQLDVHLKRLRAMRTNAYEYFSGAGPVARKLREHVKVDDWMNPQNRIRNQDLLRHMEMSFNKYPTRDAFELKELQDFIQLTKPLMTGQLDTIEFKEYDSGTVLTDLASGFYKIQSETAAQFLLILNTRLQPSQVGVMYVLGMGADEQLMYEHPEEGEWFRTDDSYTFEGLANKLRAELDLVIAPLGLSAKKSNLPVQLEEVFQKVDFIFENHKRLPEGGLQFVRHEENQSTIAIPCGTFYKWVFTDTRGQWPTRTKRFTIQVGSTEQSATPEDMNEFSRQNMVKSLHVILDNIIGALVPEAARAA